MCVYATYCHSSEMLTRRAQTTQFELGAFSEFLKPVVEELVKLRSEADTIEIKSRICTSLNVVIERAGTQVRLLCCSLSRPDPRERPDCFTARRHHQPVTPTLYVFVPSSESRLVLNGVQGPRPGRIGCSRVSY